MSAVHTRRILAVYRSATPAQVSRGLRWYADAYNEARVIAARHNLSVQTVAGIIAALSPQTPWVTNLSWADEVAGGSQIARGFRSSQGKAEMILHNPDTDPLEILGGPKVRAFYRAIIAQGFTWDVVIDRHAYDVVQNERFAVGITPRRYSTSADAYRQAAKRLAETGERLLTPCQLQAIVWVTWRDRFYAEGAFDPADQGRVAA